MAIKDKMILYKQGTQVPNASCFHRKTRVHVLVSEAP